MAEQIRDSVRISHKAKEKVYSRVGFMAKLAKNILSAEFSQSKPQNKLIDSLDEINEYVKSISGLEIEQFGQLFKFNYYLKFILNNLQSKEAVVAFQIMANTTYSRCAPSSFFTNPNLLQLCISFVVSNEPELVQSALEVFINGSFESECALNLLSNYNICDIIMSLPQTVEAAYLVSNLSYHSSPFLEKLFMIALSYLATIVDPNAQTVENIGNSEEEIKESFLMIAERHRYAMKAINHMFQLENLPEPVRKIINDLTTPKIVSNSEFYFTFGMNKKRFIRTFSKMLGHLDCLPSFYGNLLIDVMASDNFHVKWQNGKTIQCLMLPFLSNSSVWKAETVGERFLTFALNKLGRIQYRYRLFVFKTLVQYFPLNSKSNRNIGIDIILAFIEWAATFAEEVDARETCTYVLSQIAARAVIEKDKTIFAQICQHVQILEQIADDPESGMAGEHAGKIIDLIAIVTEQK